jgi:2-polyprenyl-3-methyl-5-hydroxy-6-metoxy-1,4-benzoquinol methylase
VTDSQDPEQVPADVLTEMRRYYSDRAPEFEEWVYRRGRYSLGDGGNARWRYEYAEVTSAFDRLRLAGDVLELAAGTGIWTKRLVLTARSVVALDASPEMIAINRGFVANVRVEYRIQDLFEWEPDGEYDALVMTYWLSHVPRERLDTFLVKCARALKPNGICFVADGILGRGKSAGLQEPTKNPQVVVRRLQDGRTYRIVRNSLDPNELTRSFERVGIRMEITETPTHFLYGTGTRVARNGEG